MKIISSFKDYYDFYAPFTKDEVPVYKREVDSILVSYKGGGTSQVVEKIKHVWEQFRLMPIAPTTTGFVGFCGRLYPFYEDCYTLESTLAWVDSQVKKEGAYSRIDKHRTFGKSWYEFFLKDKPTKISPKNHPWFTKANLERFFSNFKSDIGDGAFLALGVPAFVLKAEWVWPEYDGPRTSDWKVKQIILELNPELKRYKFDRAVDVQQTYQQLDQYLGNNLAYQVNIEPRGITDKLKAEAHGFNQWSFKTHKEDSKKNKKRKDKLLQKREKIIQKSSQSKDQWKDDLKIILDE